MNYIKHLKGFYEKVVKDSTFNPSYISLYIALFKFWNFNRFRNPISISRDEVMRISRINSKATYHKCIKNLHSLGYIDYQSSYNTFIGSQIFAGELKPASRYTKRKNQLMENRLENINSEVEEHFVKVRNERTRLT